MQDRSIIIIGGGIAGLSAGCYAAMNGFHVRVFEMHKKPGGLCTSWKRQGYVVNGCIHWLVGSSPATSLNRIWRELGALQGRAVVDPEEYGRIESADGRRFIVYTDLDRLEQHMLGLAPQDGPVIREFIAEARKCTRLDPPVEKAPEVSGLFDMLKLIVTQFPLLRMLWKWNRVSLREYGKRFKDPLLREAFPLFFMPDFPLSFMLLTFGWMHKKASGYPVGGSLEFSRAIEKRLLDLGGEIKYKARVQKVLVENDVAVGIRLEDGTEHRADHVISAADGHATIFDLLGGAYGGADVRGYYERGTLIPFPPLVHVALGVNRIFDDVAPSAGGTAIQLSEPLMIGGVEQNYLGVRIYNFDPTLAPPGRTVLIVMFRTDYEYWKQLRGDNDRYRAEKEKIADEVVARLDKRFPGLAGQVEMRDVASPTTFVRYTGNWKGSFEGWQVTPDTWSFGRLMRKTLPGLKNFYMAGHWVEPGGGLPAAALSGRNVVQMICRIEKRKFTTSTP